MANIFGIDAGNLLKNLGGEGLTDQERKRALAFGLLHLGAGTLANNRGHYGAFGPAAGAGLTQGLLGYQAQLGREEAGAKARKQAEAMQKAFSGAISQPTIPGQEKQGFSVGSNWAESEGDANFMSQQARDYNDLQAQIQRQQGVETFPLMPDAPLVNSQLLPGFNRPEPLEDFRQEELMRQMQPKTPPVFANALQNAPMRNQDEMIVPKTIKGPDTLGPEQFDMLQAARSLMQSGQPEMMQKGFEIYASLKTPDAVKPQLVERWNPATNQVEKVWMTPGSSDGVMAGLAKPDTGSVSNLGQLIAERDSLPPGHPARKMYDAAIDKAATHAPAAQMINYGPPVAGERDGQPVYFQPSKTGSAPAIIEGITPPSKDKGKGLPASALKMQQEQLDAIATAAGIQADLGGLQKQIESGTLKFGPIENRKNQALNATGMSTPESRAYGSFMSSLEKLRNDSLRLNAGVQTDGDAQRAWNELFANINDTKFVKNRLAEIRRINERAVNIRSMNVDTIRQNFGAESLDTTGYQTQESVIQDGNETPSNFSAMPKFGEIRNGYRFIGGKNADPNDPKNWKEVKP